MPLDIAAVQASLMAAGLDGWLLYDFHGSNPIAQSLAGLVNAPKMTTRRWYYFIPSRGEPRGLVHAIERHNLDSLPGTMQPYAGRRSLDEGLDALLAGTRTIAMEYSPGGDIPYLSRVDAGTLESVRQRGVEVVSSGDLVQEFEAVWTASQIATHVAASDALYRIKDRAFDVLRQVASGTATTEYALQQQMVGWFAEEGLVSSDPPVVAVMANAGNPHYLPTASSHRPIERDQLVLLDLWGKQARRAPCTPTSRGWPTRAPWSPPRWHAPSTPSPEPATRPSQRYRRRSTRGGTLAGAKSITRPAKCSSGPATTTRSCIVPATASERASMAMGRTSMTTRRATNGSCCPDPGSPSNPACTSRRSASARRSTSSSWGRRLA